MTEGDPSTAMCRHFGCEKRFPLSRYGNRTHTSGTTRRGRHLFCSLKCRVAHHRRMAALKGGGVTESGITAPGGTHPKGGVTPLEIKQQNQWPLPPKITTDQPHFKPRALHPKVVPDATYPGMYRVRRPDGGLSDMVNLTRANDAANNQ